MPEMDLLNRSIVAVLCLLIAVPNILGQTSKDIAPHQKSDTFLVNEKGKKIRLQHGELASTNFQIAGIDLTLNGELLGRAAKVLGSVSTTSSGDAADYDEQACYRSAVANDGTHLIFGRGEVNVYFVLSIDGSTRKKNAVCLRSEKITLDAATESGLKLMQTEEQVIAVLGLPTSRSGVSKEKREELRYEFETRKHVAPQELARQLKEALQKDPALNLREFHDNYDFFDLDESIRAQFVGDRLVRLTVSWVATT
ncbi:MAG TPA: hypothetical protein VGB94_03395 [Acidobacteriaceae bacterium]